MATNPTSPVSAAPQPAAMPEEKFALTSSRHFPEWLARENRTFQGLPLDSALAARGAKPRCGLLVIDTSSGDTVEWLRIEGVAIGSVSDEIQRVISIDES
jgi:hypothetical protein